MGCPPLHMAITHQPKTPPMKTSDYAARAALAEADGPAVPEGREPASVVSEPSDNDILACMIEAASNVPDGQAIGITNWDREAIAAALAVLALCGHHPAPVPVNERLQQLEDLAADAVSGLRYIEQTHGRLYGVGWDRVYEKADRLQPAHALPTPEATND